MRMADKVTDDDRQDDQQPDGEDPLKEPRQGRDGWPPYDTARVG
ncbi:hypothetical protein B0E53_03386 [Micromonospora sp. MH33]|nr:hypothetical protein B0E53_03386 [Micromonospora sp. MH33]